MEFTKLSEVEVVETANDTDKVLIEQNGEIKRVPKTEVGGGGGNVLIITADETGANLTANMTLTEAIAAFNKRELTGAVFYTPADGGTWAMYNLMLGDASAMVGAECMMCMEMTLEMPLFWTESGISTEPPA